MYAVYSVFDALGLVARVLFFPIKAVAWALRMVTYLFLLALVVGGLVGLWFSGVLPWSDVTP